MLVASESVWDHDHLRRQEKGAIPVTNAQVLLRAGQEFALPAAVLSGTCFAQGSDLPLGSLPSTNS
eukprot:15067647-Alexandrium_andersonii.AAC.1